MQIFVEGSDAAGRSWAPPWVRPWRSLELSRAATETDAMLRSPFAGPSGPHTRKHARGLEYFAEADHAGTASQSAGPPAPFSSPPSSSKPVYLPPFVVAVEEEEGEACLQCAGAQRVSGSRGQKQGGGRCTLRRKRALAFSRARGRTWWISSSTMPLSEKRVTAPSSRCRCLLAP